MRVFCFVLFFVFVSAAPTPHLIFTHGSKVTRVNMDVTGQLDLITGSGNITACDYLYIDGVGYYADVKNKYIGQMNLDGSSVGKAAIVIVPNTGLVEGLAVNWIDRSLIWSDLTARRIYTSRLDGSSIRTLISTGLVRPRAMALHPQAG